MCICMYTAHVPGHVRVYMYTRTLTFHTKHVASCDILLWRSISSASFEQHFSAHGHSCRCSFRHVCAYELKSDATVWYGMVWSGYSGVGWVWNGTLVEHGMTWYGIVLSCGMGWHDMLWWYGMIWGGIVSGFWSGMGCYGMVQVWCCMALYGVEGA